MTRSGLLPATGENSEDSIHLEEPGTGRSVPTTPLQVSPQELPTGETVSEVGQSSSSAAHIEGEESDVALNIPDIVVTITEDDDHCETPPPELSGGFLSVVEVIFSSSILLNLFFFCLNNFPTNF